MTGMHRDDSNPGRIDRMLKHPRRCAAWWGSVRADIKLWAARRPAVQPARPPARVQTRLLAEEEPEAGPTPISPKGSAGTVSADGPPLKAETVPLTGWALEPPLYGERGEHPYPVRELDRDWELLLAALEPADGGTEAAS